MASWRRTVSHLGPWDRVVSSFSAPFGTPEFNKYFLKAYYVPGSVLGGEGTAPTQKNKTSTSRSWGCREGGGWWTDHEGRWRECWCGQQSSEGRAWGRGLSLLSYTNMTLVTRFLWSCRLPLLSLVPRIFAPGDRNLFPFTREEMKVLYCAVSCSSS